MRKNIFVVFRENLNKEKLLSLFLAINMLIMVVCLLYEFMWQDLVISFTMSMFTAYVFYLLVVVLPEYRKKEIIKSNFDSQYKLFKEDCISIFLVLLHESISVEQEKELVDQEKFKIFFSHSKWGNVANELEEHEYYQKQLICAIEIFVSEIQYALNLVDFDNEQMLQSFKHYSHFLHRLKYTDFNNYDDVKSCMRNLWEVFTGCSWIDGYSKNDILKDKIKEL